MKKTILFLISLFISGNILLQAQSTITLVRTPEMPTKTNPTHASTGKLQLGRYTSTAKLCTFCGMREQVYMNLQENKDGKISATFTLHIGGYLDFHQIDNPYIHEHYPTAITLQSNPQRIQSEGLSNRARIYYKAIIPLSDNQLQVLTFSEIVDLQKEPNSYDIYSRTRLFRTPQNSRVYTLLQ
jgi:hypothetical protein